jgi:hypothetical protein
LRIGIKAALDGSLDRKVARERNRPRLFEEMARAFAAIEADAADA